MSDAKEGSVMDSSVISSNEPQGAEGAGSKASPEDPSQLFRKHKHKVKIDDQESEVGYDDLIGDYQTRKVSNKRLQEAAQLRREVEESIINPLKQGNLQALSKYVPKEQLLAWAEEQLSAHIEWSSLSPAEQKARLLEQENGDLKSKLTTREKAEKDAEKSTKLRQIEIQIDEEISQSLSELGRKPTPRLVARVVEDMLANMAAKGSALPAKDAFGRALKSVKQDVQEYLSETPISELIEVLPKRVLDELRNYQVSQVRGAPTVRPEAQQSTAQAIARGRDRKKVMTTDDWYKEKERKLTGR